MSPPPHHSVIVPAYNAPRTIRTTVESVLSQTTTDLELIVIDDGSADQTPAVVSSYADRDPRVRLIRQANTGTAGARNRGLAEARGELISLLDNDDAWLPHHLERAEATLADRGVGVSYADAWILSDETKLLHRRTSLSFYADRAAPDAGAEQALAALLRKNFIIASSATLTRTALELVGEFDAELRGTDDWDMWLRVTGAGLSAHLSDPEPTVLLRRSERSQSSDLAMMVRGNTEVLERALARLPQGSPARPLAERRLSEDREWLRELESPSVTEALAGRVRRRLGPIKRMALERRDWIEAPAAVREAIPELADGPTI